MDGGPGARQWCGSFPIQQKRNDCRSGHSGRSPDSSFDGYFHWIFLGSLTGDRLFTPRWDSWLL